jgi:hypothetical protein
MQFPRYEFVIPREHERCSTGRRARPRPEPGRRTARAERCVSALRRLLRRRESRPVLAIHEYLDLEFTVDDRR